MKKKRLIPIVLILNGWVVQSKNFTEYQNLGNPLQTVTRLSEWCSDEIIYLDITKNNQYDLNRDDQNYPNRKDFNSIIKDVSKRCFAPFCVGGNLKNIEQINDYITMGADKISINTMAIENTNLLKEASLKFGSQSIVCSIDAKKENGKYFVYNSKIRRLTELLVSDFSKKVEDYGAGEILINSVDRDGSGEGFDIELINLLEKNTNLPIIACGGAGDYHHFEEVYKKTDIDAVAAANFFQYKDQSIYYTKKFLVEKNINVREPDLFEI